MSEKVVDWFVQTDRIKQLRVFLGAYKLHRTCRHSFFMKITIDWMMSVGLLVQQH